MWDDGEPVIDARDVLTHVYDAKKDLPKDLYTIDGNWDEMKSHPLYKPEKCKHFFGMQ